MVNPWAKDMPETYPYDLEESTAMRLRGLLTGGGSPVLMRTEVMADENLRLVTD